MEALLIRPKNEAELNEIKKFINIYHADDKDFQKAAIRIYPDGMNNSKIIFIRRIIFLHS